MTERTLPLSRRLLAAAAGAGRTVTTLFPRTAPAADPAGEVLPGSADRDAHVARLLEQNIAALRSLHQREGEKAPWGQQLIERASGTASRPSFAFTVLGVVCLWVAGNWLAPLVGLSAFDPYPFMGLQDLSGVGGFLLALVILSTQDRQGRLAQRQAQLELQINLLAEQKAAKIIELLEELRRDLPAVRDRHDPEAASLGQAADPHLLLDALEQSLETVLEREPEPTAETDRELGAQ